MQPLQHMHAHRPTLVGGLLRVVNPALMPSGSAFAWNRRVLVTCGHIQPQTISRIYNATGVEAEIDHVVVFAKEDVSFVVCNVPHGFTVLPRQLIKPEAGLHANVLKTFSTQDTLTEVETTSAQTTQEVEQIELSLSKQAGRSNPVVWKYTLDSPVSAGTSGSPVLNEDGHVLAMHVGMSSCGQTGYGVPMRHVAGLFKRYVDGVVDSA